MKLPVAPTAVGLLAGIGFVLVLQPYLDNTFGMALLIGICILIANCGAWLIRKGK